MRRSAPAALLMALLLVGCGRTSGPDSAAVAKWAVGAGGTVRVEDRSLPVKKAEDVPEGEFLIEEIDLTGTDVTDEQLAQLAKLTHLDRLRLHGTSVSDTGLQYLTKFQELTLLELSKTRVTDAGIPALASLKGLEKVYLYNTRVTQQGVDSLKSQLPGVMILHR